MGGDCPTRSTEGDCPICSTKGAAGYRLASPQPRFALPPALAPPEGLAAVPDFAPLALDFAPAVALLGFDPVPGLVLDFGGDCRS